MATAAYFMLRVLRLGAWIFFLVWSFYFWTDRTQHLNSFLQLSHFANAMFYVSACVGVFAGLLELMMREQAGYARPRLGQIIPDRVTA